MLVVVKRTLGAEDKLRWGRESGRKASCTNGNVGPTRQAVCSSWHCVLFAKTFLAWMQLGSTSFSAGLLPSFLLLIVEAPPLFTSGGIGGDNRQSRRHRFCTESTFSALVNVGNVLTVLSMREFNLHLPAIQCTHTTSFNPKSNPTVECTSPSSPSLPSPLFHLCSDKKKKQDVPENPLLPRKGSPCGNRSTENVPWLCVTGLAGDGVPAQFFPLSEEDESS